MASSFSDAGLIAMMPTNQRDAKASGWDEIPGQVLFDRIRSAARHRVFTSELSQFVSNVRSKGVSLGWTLECASQLSAESITALRRAVDRSLDQVTVRHDKTSAKEAQNSRTVDGVTAAIERERTLIIVSAIRKLDFELQELVEMHLAGATYAEIAQKLDVSTTTVCGWHSKALRD